MMARKKKKKPAADASAEAGEPVETLDAETVEPSDVVTRTLAPIDVRQADPHPAEVHLSLEPEAVGSADHAGAAGAASTPSRDPEPASVEDVDLELRDERDGETAVARDGIGDASDDSEDAPRDEHGDEADDEDHGESRADRARRHRRPQFDEITEEDVSGDERERRGGSRGDDSKNAFATPAESPTRSPRSSDASGAFAAAIRSPAAFLKNLTFSVLKDRRGGGDDDGGATRDRSRGASLDEKSLDDDGVAASGADRGGHLAKREKKRDKRRAKKARRRLKRLVHAANTMGSAVSAKEQTTTQLALCLQLGLTTSLRNQKSAASFAAVSDVALAETDAAKTLVVKASNVDDGTKLPSFRFVTHAPSRFERVRSAWGLSLPKYAESFALEMRVSRDAAIVARRDGGDALQRGVASHDADDRVDSGEQDPPSRDVVSSPRHARHAREFSAGSSEGAGALSATDEGERFEGVGSEGLSEEDEEGDARHARRRSGGVTGDFAGEEDEEEARSVFSKRGRARTDGGAEPSERFSVVSQDVAFSVSERHGRDADADADDVALRADVFLPSQTSLRVISSASASGKSSSWFFCSKDSRFLVKTCTAKERDVLLDILGEYSGHAVRHRDASLLPQYYGLYTIEVGSRSAHFIIMNYWFATMHAISRRFDLKGSTKGRRASRREKAKGDAAVLKDLDFLESALAVQNPMAEEVKAAIATDVAFMERNRLIDYSMMVGLHFYDDDAEGDGAPLAAATGDAKADCADETAKTSARFAGGGDERAGATSGEETGASHSPSRRRRRPGYGSLGGSNGGDAGPLASARFSDAESPPPTTPVRATREGDDAIAGEGLGVAEKEPEPTEGARVLAGPFAEPAADDTRLQFQLRALETPFGLAYLGIIDILTQYGPAKAAENLCFGTLMCGADISCQPPEKYARRFKRFIDAHVLKVAPACGETENASVVAPLEIE